MDHYVRTSQKPGPDPRPRPPAPQTGTGDKPTRKPRPGFVFTDFASI